MLHLASLVLPTLSPSSKNGKGSASPDYHLAALANEGLEQIQADSYIGIEIRRPWVEL